MLARARAARAWWSRTTTRPSRSCSRARRRRSSAVEAALRRRRHRRGGCRWRPRSTARWSRRERAVPRRSSRGVAVSRAARSTCTPTPTAAPYPTRPRRGARRARRRSSRSRCASSSRSRRCTRAACAPSSRSARQRAHASSSAGSSGPPAPRDRTWIARAATASPALQDALGPTGGRRRAARTSRRSGSDSAPPVEAPREEAGDVDAGHGANHGKPYPPAGGAEELPPPNAPRPVEPPVTSGACSRPRRRSERPPEPPAARGDARRRPRRLRRETRRGVAARLPGGAAPDRRGARGVPARDGRRATWRSCGPRRRRSPDLARCSARQPDRGRARRPSSSSRRRPSPCRPSCVTGCRAGFVAPVSTPIVEHMRALPDAPAPHLTQRPRQAGGAGRAGVAEGRCRACGGGRRSRGAAADVVAEKTGYPAEMLGDDMELEADLGIDSIKRVEILAAIHERAPGLPEVGAAELAQLRTLGQIVEHMRALPAPPRRLRRQPPAPARRELPRPRAGRRRRPSILESAAARGGRREDRLPGRDARAGHGARGRPGHRLDQARRDPRRHPRARARACPRSTPTELARCRTLGQIVESHARRRAHRLARRPATPAGGAGRAGAARPRSAAASWLRSRALLMRSWRTRPATRRRCSALDMELEADLGIDSIKRVEILSAIRERAPGLPEVERRRAGALRTLGQIVEHMRAAPARRPRASANGHAPAAHAVRRGRRAASAAPRRSPCAPRVAGCRRSAWRRRGSATRPRSWSPTTVAGSPALVVDELAGTA